MMMSPRIQAIQNIIVKILGEKISFPPVVRLRKEALVAIVLIFVLILAVAVWIFDRRAYFNEENHKTSEMDLTYHPEENWYRAQSTSLSSASPLVQNAAKLYPGSANFEQDQRMTSDQAPQQIEQSTQFIEPDQAESPNIKTSSNSIELNAAHEDEFNDAGRETANANEHAVQTEKQNESEITPLKIPKNDPHQTVRLSAGSIIPAVLLTGINSDLPGIALASVRLPVYDSITGQHILIPQGSRLILAYNSQIAFGQRRIFLQAQRIIFPDGRALSLQAIPLSDLAGQSGFHDQQNNHYQQIFGSALVLSIISAGMQLGQTPRSSVLEAPSPSQITAGSMTETLGDVASQTIAKNLNIQPTLSVRPGYLFNLILNQDVVVT